MIADMIDAAARSQEIAMENLRVRRRWVNYSFRQSGWTAESNGG